MNIEQVCNCVRDQNAPYIRVTDANGKLLFAIEDSDNVENTIQKLEATLPVFESYGRVKIQAANETRFKQQYKGCLHYDCQFPGNKTGAVATLQQQPQSATGSMLEMLKVFQIFQTMSGNNNNGNAEARIQALEKEFDYKLKLMELEKKNNDPTKYFAMFGPAAMRMAGMKPDEVRETLMLTQMSMSAANSGTQMQTNKVAGTGETTTLTTSVRSLEEIAKIPNEQKNAEIENLMLEIGKKVPAEHMLLVLEIVNAKPELVEKVIQMHNANMI